MTQLTSAFHGRQLALLGFLALASCAHGSVIGGPLPDSTRGTKPLRAGAAFAGFDKRDFPGLHEMEVWYAMSPYAWVGYYLPAPCFAGTPWAGHRQELIDRHWGLAVLYVGCPHGTPTAAQGQLDGDDAVMGATGEGFPLGTTIFLDVERAEPYPPEVDAYVRTWVAQVLSHKFTPGIYGHRVNAAALFASQKAVYSAAGDTRAPPFWVVNSQGFDFAKLPAESGFPFATVWQSPTNAKETWGDVTFQIDRNVAVTKSPSQ